MGLLRVKETVPALVAILDQRDRDSEDLRGAAVVALIHRRRVGASSPR